MVNFSNKLLPPSSHQSCIILLSWEKLKQITTLEGENRPIRSLHLKGLGETAQEILKEKGLTDSERWPELINLYQGHPTWLNIIASTILELFDGEVSPFLAEFNHVYLGDIEPFLEVHLERLSELEKNVTDWLTHHNKPVNLSQKLTDSSLSTSQFCQGIQSLARRGLVEKRSQETHSGFCLDPLFREFINLHTVTI